MQQKPAPTSETFHQSNINDVIVRPLRKFDDRRGWLSELFRHDELPAEFLPVMSYISSTRPGVTRGPHEHVDQADLFCFIGPSNFKLRMWDNRPDSSTYQAVMTLVVGQDNPQSVVIPKGVVHAYQNVERRTASSSIVRTAFTWATTARKQLMRSDMRMIRTRSFAWTTISEQNRRNAGPGLQLAARPLTFLSTARDYRRGILIMTIATHCLLPTAYCLLS